MADIWRVMGGSRSCTVHGGVPGGVTPLVIAATTPVVSATGCLVDMVCPHLTQALNAKFLCLCVGEADGATEHLVASRHISIDR